MRVPSLWGTDWRSGQRLPTIYSVHQVRKAVAPEGGREAILAECVGGVVVYQMGGAPDACDPAMMQTMAQIDGNRLR